ncbi:hypothetical protein XENTR_v10013327 [Xenopus tropicalis]|nr:hypothetical protein XENTR_v10013327 [Xenopus tropicalis]
MKDHISCFCSFLSVKPVPSRRSLFWSMGNGVLWVDLSFQKKKKYLAYWPTGICNNASFQEKNDISSLAMIGDE